MVKKLFALMLLTILAFSFVACGNKIRYNAILYDDTGDLMHEEFLKENLTRGAFYVDRFLDDNSYPRNMTHLIKNKEEFDAIFIEFPSEIDFTQSMVCIFVFTCNDKRTYEISKISTDNQVLRIEVSSISPRKGHIGDAVPSWQRCFVVVMDRLDVNSVEFSEK